MSWRCPSHQLSLQCFIWRCRSFFLFFFLVMAASVPWHHWPESQAGILRCAVAAPQLKATGAATPFFISPHPPPTRPAAVTENEPQQTLFQHIDRHLPAYAQPQFLRVAERPSLTSHMTTTFKQIKTQLRQVRPPAAMLLPLCTLCVRLACFRSRVGVVCPSRCQSHGACMNGRTRVTAISLSLSLQRWVSVIWPKLVDIPAAVFGISRYLVQNNLRRRLKLSVGVEAQSEWPLQ